MKQAVARQFQLTPVPVPVDPSAKRAKKMKEEVSPSHETTGATGDVKMERESSPESCSDSSDSNSDFSSEDGSSDVSDLDKFEEAYEEFGKLTEVTWLVTQVMMSLDLSAPVLALPHLSRTSQHCFSQSS